MRWPWQRKQEITQAHIDAAVAALGREVVELQKAKATIRDMGDDDMQLELAVGGLRDHPAYWIIKALFIQRMATEVSMGDGAKYGPGLSLALAILVLKVEGLAQEQKQAKADAEAARKEEQET